MEGKERVGSVKPAQLSCKVHGLTYFLLSPQSILLFTEMSHHIYYPHIEARGKVNLKDYVVQYCSADESDADGKVSKSVYHILQHRVHKLYKYKNKMKNQMYASRGKFSTDPGYPCLQRPPQKNQKNHGTTMQHPHTASIQDPKDKS